MLKPEQKALIRAAVKTIHELRATVRSDADLVDAMCALNGGNFKAFGGENAVRVALRCSPGIVVAGRASAPSC